MKYNKNDWIPLIIFQYLSFFVVPEKLMQFFLSSTLETSSGQLGSTISLQRSKSIVVFSFVLKELTELRLLKYIPIGSRPFY